MAALPSLFNRLLVLMLHLGCCFFSSSSTTTIGGHEDPPPPRKRRKISPLSSSPSPSASSPDHRKSKSIFHSIRTCLDRLLSSIRNKPTTKNHDHTDPQPPSDGGAEGADITATVKRGSFSSRMEIYPCVACGEVLSKPQLLELHQATKHSLSVLPDGESGRNILQIIFHSGWIGPPAAIHRVLKIHNAQRTLSRFEEYRDLVRSRAAGRHTGGGGGGEEERCIADGNERLRFYCSTVMCSLGGDGGVCGGQYCTTCAIVRNGFSGKMVDVEEGIATHATAWDAHVSLPEELEEDFAFLHVRRAMIVCRVIAGRVARCGGGVVPGLGGDEQDQGVDSVVPVTMRRRGGGGGGGPRSSWAEDEELLVFNPRAVLPCFIIIYGTGTA